MKDNKELKTAEMKDNKEYKSNWLHHFLWWCAGVDREIIERCQHEWNKYACMGASVLFTGIFASLAGGYALYSVFRPGILGDDNISVSAIVGGIFFGLLWGTMIFNLDRYIVCSFRKSNNPSPKQRFWENTKYALPRIILAVVIAFTISKPIEVKIFEKRLSEKINEMQTAKMTLNNKKNYYAYGLGDLDERENKNEVVKARLDSLYHEDTPEIKQAKSEKETLEEEKNQIHKNWENEDSRCNGIWKNDDNFKTQWNDSLRSFVRMPKTEANLKDTARRKYRQHSSNRRQYKSEEDEKQAEIKSKGKEIEELEKEYKKRIKKEQDKNKAEKDRIDSMRLVRETRIMIKDTVDKKISIEAFSNTFATQLEALGELKRSHVIWSDTIGMSVEEKRVFIEAAKSDKRSSRTFWWLSFALTILFLVVELLPILTKLIIARGSYDELNDWAESKIKEQIVTEKSIHIEIEQERLRQEVEANKLLMSKIANAQAELLKTAIEEWRKAELEKIHADPSKYIQSNTTKS